MDCGGGEWVEKEEEKEKDHLGKIKGYYWKKRSALENKEKVFTFFHKGD